MIRPVGVNKDHYGIHEKEQVTDKADYLRYRISSLSNSDSEGFWWAGIWYSRTEMFVLILDFWTMKAMFWQTQIYDWNSTPTMSPYPLDQDTATSFPSTSVNDFSHYVDFTFNETVSWVAQSCWIDWHVSQHFQRFRLSWMRICPWGCEGLEASLGHIKIGIGYTSTFPGSRV